MKIQEILINMKIQEILINMKIQEILINRKIQTRVSHENPMLQHFQICRTTIVRC